MAKKNHIIMGSAIGLAALAVAIDHTRHKLPEPVIDSSSYIVEEGTDDSSPCALGDNPCSLGSSPCSL